MSKIVKFILVLCSLSGLFLLSLALNACSKQNVPLPPAPMSVDVTILADPGLIQEGMGYEGEYRPSSVAVASGGTVTWNNTDNKPHTIVSYDGLFNARVNFGESFSYTFTQNGTYKYHDVLYDGMDGVVHVR